MNPMIKTEPAQSLFARDSQFETIAEGRDYEYDTCANRFTLKRASPSGLIFIDPRPTDAELGTIYPEAYEPYRFDELPKPVRVARDFVQARKVSFLQKLAAPDAQILDVGCGNGALLRLLQKKGPATWSLHANDLNQASLQRLSEEGIQVHPGRIESLDLPETFDVIILNQVIEHFADVHGLLEACRRLLRTGGVLLIETPSTEGWDAKLFRKSYWGGYHIPRHFYLFNDRLLREIVEQHGFKGIHSESLASPAFWVQSVHHWLLERGYPRLARIFTVRNFPIIAFFTLVDLVTIRLGRSTSNLRLISRKENAK